MDIINNISFKNFMWDEQEKKRGIIIKTCIRYENYNKTFAFNIINKKTNNQNIYMFKIEGYKKICCIKHT